MNSLLYKNREFISNLASSANNKQKLLKFIKNSTNSEIRSFGELAYNILHGGVTCTPHMKKKLKPYKSDIRLLSHKTGSTKKKKSKLLKGKGLLLSVLLPLAIQTISRLFK